jgi:hypothetical protein
MCMYFVLNYLTGLEKPSGGISFALAPNFSLGFCFKYYSSYYQGHFIFDEAFIILSPAMKPRSFLQFARVVYVSLSISSF